ncbi:MAG: urease accessory protein [Thermoleophilaceae bacterium]|nr:urease accessory protein [Thermoleophilaceae bacterium]
MTALCEGGLLALRVRCDAAGRTVVAERRQRFPLRMTVPMYLDADDPGMAFVYVQNPTGGVFAGDRLETRVLAEAGTRTHVTTQSASKLYRMDGGRAVQVVGFSLGEGAYLEYVPDPLIPHAGAHLEQSVVVDLAPGASFVAAESLAPGRGTSGERFAYDRLALRTKIRSGGDELCVDALELQPSRRAPDRPGLLGGHEYLATLLAVAPGRDAEALAAQLDALLASEREVHGAAAPLPNGAGAVARILAGSAPAARRVLLEAWRVARGALAGLGAPAVRK